MRKQAIGIVTVIVTLALGSAPAWASFHFTQIDQVIGGVNGDTTAQAIELRMRGGLQNQYIGNGVTVMAYDSTGGNPVTIIDLNAVAANPAVANAGSTVLITSPAFNAKTLPNTLPDYTMTNLIPASYLAAGRLTFEAPAFGILWSIAWGGASYTGPTNGATVNDADGDFGKLAISMPTSGVQSLLFNGTFSDPSTDNASDYSLSAGPAVFTNNAGNTFAVAPEPATLTVLGTVLLLLARRRTRRGFAGIAQ